MKRRRFIGVAGATLVLSSATWLTLREQPELADIHPAIQTTFDEYRRIVEIGKAYREAYPDEDNLEVLQGLIAKAGASDALAETIKQEFAAESTVVILGWILSRTEARQCAVYSLSDS